MTFWMPAPGIMAAAGGGGAPAFVNASAPLYVSTGTSGSNFPAAVAPVAGNLAISFAAIYRTTTWYDSFRDMDLGGGTHPYEKPVLTGGVSGQTVYNAIFADQPMFRVLTGADAGADLSWTLPTNKLHMYGVTLQFKGCRESAPFIDGQIVATDTSRTRALPNRYRYNAISTTTQPGPTIKVSGPGRLAVMVGVLLGAGYNKALTPPAGWTEVSIRSSQVGSDGACAIYVKPIDADEVGETWTLASTHGNWGLYGFALLPKNEVPTMKDMTVRNDTNDLPYAGGTNVASHSANSYNFTQYQQLPEASNRRVYAEHHVVYVNAGIPEDMGISMYPNATDTAAPSSTRIPGSQFGPNGLSWRFHGVSNASGGPANPVAPPALTDDDVAMIAWDRDSGDLWCGKNGVWSRDPLTQTGNFTGVPADWYLSTLSGYFNTYGEWRLHDMYCEYGPPLSFKCIGML